ncbi:GD24249 [Drosophila simulans]|uniref:GD24249 n=1 Tax=Drosophila simulans TaxID=7240 RepID=B4QAI0_DROSI|nr:GD24249 [Drosophila simulans]
MTTPATTDKNNDNDNNTSSNSNTNTNNNTNKSSNESRQQQHDMTRTTTMAAGKASGKMREENIWHTLRRAKSDKMWRNESKKSESDAEASPEVEFYAAKSAVWHFERPPSRKSRSFEHQHRLKTLVNLFEGCSGDGRSRVKSG